MISNSPSFLKTNPSIPPVGMERQCKPVKKYIDSIQFRVYEIDTWYASPYPDEYGKQRKLFICEYCLKYMKLENTYRYHLGVCIKRRPPGKKIYHHGTVSIFETDGAHSKLYCQNLSLLGKLFIDHKMILFDIEDFLFYALCEDDQHGSHLLGYFSKEKRSREGNNLSCLMTLPPYQRMGYGKLLIDFSYKLSKIEGELGSPEHPLSDLGEWSYRSYWAWALLEILRELKDTVTMHQLSKMTAIKSTHVISTLHSIGMLKYLVEKNDKAYITPKLLDECVNSGKIRRPRLTVEAAHVEWNPPDKTVEHLDFHSNLETEQFYEEEYVP